jgi:PAS domain S-box-containing protein
MVTSHFGPESEARSHPRYAVHNFVSYCYECDRFLTVALNLGLGGLKIQTYHFLPKEEQLDLRLVLGRNSIWLKGRSVYSQLLSEGRYISGLRFVEVSEQDQYFLEDCLLRNKSEEASQECDKTYRTFFEEIRDAICITTREGKIVDFNQCTLDLLGFTGEQMMGTNVREIYVYALDRIRFQQEIEKKGFLRDYEVRFRRKDGREVDCLLTATVRRESDGNILGYQCIIRDITERKRAEEQIKKENEELKRRTIELEAINKELEAFRCFVSHELHTSPLESRRQ